MDEVIHMMKCYLNGHDYHMTSIERDYMKRHGYNKYDKIGYSDVMYKCSECGKLEMKNYIIITEIQESDPEQSSFLDKIKSIFN